MMAEILHRELRQITEGYLRHEPLGHTLQLTAPVNEARFRLIVADLPDISIAAVSRDQRQLM